MKTVTKRLSVVLLAVAMICSFAAFLSVGGCGGAPSNPIVPDSSSASVRFDGGSVARLGEYYDPEIVAAEGTTITGVTLTDSGNSSIAIDERYGFTPSAYGAYYYRVTATDGVHEKTFDKTVSVRDESAPEIIAMPNAKTVESGIYSDFDKDLQRVEVSSSNEAILPYITKKVIAIEKDGVEIRDENGFSAYLFDECGEYNVTVAVIAPDGKSSYGQYEITVKDDSAPIITIAANSFAWAENGKVKLPEPEVYDISDCEVSVSVKKGANAVSVTAGSVAGSAGDVFEVTYTATDDKNNTSTAKTTLKVMPEGTLFDGSDVYFTNAFTSAEGLVEYADGVNLKGDAGDNSFTFSGAEFGFDLSGYKAITVSAENYGGKAVSASVYAVNGNSFAEIGEGVLNVGADELTVSLAGAGKIGGLKITFNSTEKLWIGLSEITVSDNEGAFASGGTLASGAVSTIDFSQDSFYTGAQISGDYKKSTVSVFGSSAAAGVVTLPAKGYASAVWSAQVNAGTVNYIEALVYAQKAGYITLGLVCGGDVKGGTFALNRGVNVIRRYIGARAALNVSGVKITEVSGYANEITIKQINLYNKTSFTDGEVFTSAATGYTVAYGEQFALPGLTDAQAGVSASATVTVKKGGTTLLSGAAEGAKINLYTLSGGGAGSYTLVYSATDVLGGAHTKTVSLTAESKKLSVSVAMTKDYYAGDTIMLPDPTIEGSLATGVTAVNKYYRSQGGLSWKSANAGFTVGASTYVDVRYSITIKGSASVMYEYELFVHENGVNFDYELLADGTYSGDGDHYEERCPAVISSYWSHDGKNSLFYAGSQYYDSCTGFVWDTPKQIDAFDAVVFWAYAEKDISDVITVCVHDGDKWNENPNVKILKGEHKYVYKLERTSTQITKLCFTTKRSEDFYVDSMTFVKLADVEFSSIDGILINNEEFSVEKPVINGYSDKAFSADDVNNAKYTLSIKPAGSEEKATVHTFKSDELKLKLVSGSYEVVLKVNIGGFEWTSEQTISVRNVAASFTAPHTGYTVGNQYTVQAPVLSGEGESAVHYRKVGADDWTLATNGKITFTAAGDYQIKLSAWNDNGTDEEIYQVVARDASTVADFETDEDGNHFGEGRKYEPAGWSGGVTDEWAANGKYSLKVRCIMDSWYGIIYDTPVQLATPTDTFSFWLKSEADIKNYAFEIKASTGKWHHVDFDAKKGAHQYVLKIDAEISDVYQVIFRSLPGYGTFYFDGLEASVFDYAFPEVAPESVKEGDEINIGRASGSEITDESVSYKLVGSTATTDVELDGGTFKTTIATEGVYEFVYTLKCKGVTFSKTYRVEVLGKTIQWIAPVSSLTVGEELIISVPTSEELTLQNVKIYVGKADGDLTELEISGGKAKTTPSEVGYYTVKIVASWSGGSREKVYNVWVRDKNVIADYEVVTEGEYHGKATPVDPNVFVGTIVTENVGDGANALRIFPTNDSWAEYNFEANGGSAVELTAKTDTIEFWVYSPKDLAVTDNDYCWIIEIHDGMGWQSAKIAITTGLHKYTATFGRAFNKVARYGFRANSTTGWFYVDGIKAVVSGGSDSSTEKQLNDIQTGYAVGVAQTVAFPNAEVTEQAAKIRKAGTTSWTELTVSGGNVSFTLSEAATYELELSGKKEDKAVSRTYKILGRAANSLCFGDFESDADGNYHGYGIHYGNQKGNVADCVSDEWSADGSYSWKFASSVGNAWYGFESFKLDIPNVSAVTKVCVWINAPSAINGFILWFKTDAGEVYANGGTGVTVPAGVSRIELDITLPAAATYVKAFEFTYSGSLCGGNTVYFDGFTFE